MSSADAPWQVDLAPGGRELLKAFGLDEQRLYDDPRIRVWRNLPERQNCVLDPPPGSPLPRLHIKRYKSPHGPEALVEQRAIALLASADIPTVPLIAVATHADGRGYLVSRDLAGMIQADKALLANPDESLCRRISDLALHLHRAGLHHRDLYLCHFMVHPQQPETPVHLIDAGRVARLPTAPLHLRWLVKDLAQLIYSVEDGELPPRLAEVLLDHYLASAPALTRLAVRIGLRAKVASIRRHDLSARKKRPGRRVSIDSISQPDSGSEL